MTTEHAQLLSFRYIGQLYTAPVGLTVVTALEWCGVQLTHGIGCRAGFCGACAVVYRTPENHDVQVALGCQATVVPGMDIAAVPSFPVHRAAFDPATSHPAQALNDAYPELRTCLGCNTCTKSCPVGIDVMGVVGDLLRGELESAASSSFDCVSCGLCAARCPAGITPFTAAIQARRAVSRGRGKSQELETRLAQMTAGAFADELSRLRALPREELENAYAAREVKL